MIKTQEYAERRAALLAKMEVGDLAIIPAATEQRRNNDVYYPFRQDSDFYYLTGFPEPQAIAVLFKDQHGAGKYFLFNRKRCPQQEVWTGPIVGQESAVSEYQVDSAWSLADVNKQIPKLFSQAQRIYYTLGKNKNFDRQIFTWLNAVRSQVRAGINAPKQFLDLDVLIHEQRLFKSPAEIKTMRTAAEISAAAHQKAMQSVKPNLFEYQLEAVLQQHFLDNGCRAMAYDAIVAAGANACILHYTANNQQIKTNDLILIDAGAEYQNYAADITRTFPANGKFTSAQAEIYDLVLQAQLAAIAVAKAGEPWNAMQEVIIKILTEGLVAIGILKGKVEDLIAAKAYEQFYMHNSGHWLGLDVHDVGAYKNATGAWRNLEAGMVLTIEPGLYISPAKNIPEEFWNIGVRIEDDVLITNGDADVLSKDVPKTRDAIIGLRQ